MINENVKKIAIALKEEDLATADELIAKELDARKECAMKNMQESVVATLMESSVTKSTKIGSVNVNSSHGEACLKVKDFDEALKKAPQFAAFVDGVDSKGYTAKAIETPSTPVGDGTITISINGKPSYDLFFEDGELCYPGNFSANDLLQFQKTGTLPLYDKGISS